MAAPSHLKPGAVLPLPVVWLLLGLATSCAPVTYEYAGQQYKTKERALFIARYTNETLVGYIEPARVRVGGTLNFHVPDKQTILARGIRKTGEQPAELLDYLAERTVLDHRGLYLALVKRGSFDSVVMHESAGEHVSPKRGEFVVYLYQPDPDSGGWFFASDTVEREQVHFDMKALQPAGRVQYWIDSIEALAKIR